MHLGTDQMHRLSMLAEVQIVAGENKIYSYRHRPQAAGNEATASVRMIMKRVGD